MLPVKNFINDSYCRDISIKVKRGLEAKRKNGECIAPFARCSNFKRDGFLRLMQDIRLGDINCVIVKDLSRFVRNYREAGNYIWTAGWYSPFAKGQKSARRFKAGSVWGIRAY